MILKLVLVLVTTLGVTISKFPDVPYSDIRNISPISDGSYRLPNDTIPIKYEITLEPHFDIFEFNGTVIVTIQVVEDTDTIILHANELVIESIVVEGPEGAITVENDDINSELHFLKIELGQTVVRNDILKVTIVYYGYLNALNSGFYRASYLENGEQKWFGTTQFESTSARKAFPCYDEPKFKATFIIKIIRPESYKSVSNMELDYSEILNEVDKTYMDTFEESVKMSTYLVAFVVSEMDATEQEENQAVIAAPAHIADNRGDFARDTGIATLEAIKEFTGVDYYKYISKLDQVAIPDNYFSAGAMENWGLVTYRESYILYKEGLSTSSEKQRIAAIISHELGHQWFGNVVSPLWWSYIWLNEGFATYFEHYATDQVDPTLRMMDQYVLLVSQYAMDNDALTTTRPMSHYAETPPDISRLFDRIAYEKAGSVIRMMEHFLTTDIFKKGLNIYLTNMELDAAEPRDLWNAMQDAVGDEDILDGLTVEEIMETWNTNTGFPVITVSRNEEGKVVLNQTRFFIERDAEDENDPVWIVPINYYNDDPENEFDITTPNYWLKYPEEVTDIELGEGQWFILNKEAIGYYRVDYSEELWRLNIDYLKSNNFEKIPPTTRAQIINDAFNLARSGRISYKVLIDLFGYLEQETDYIPLSSFFNGLTYLHKYLVNTGETYEIFKRFAWQILDKAYTNVTDDTTGEHTIRLNKINIYTWLCRMGHARCLEETNIRLTEKIIEHPDDQTPVYCGGLITDEDTETNWQYLFDRYMGDEAEALEKNRLLSALGCTTSPTQLKKWLDIIVGIDDEPVNSAFSISSAFTSIVSAHKFGLDTGFEYVLENFNEIHSKLSNNNVRAIITALGSRLTTVEQQTRWEEWYEGLSPSLKTEYGAAFETAERDITLNIESAELALPEITYLLLQYATEDENINFADRLPDNTKPISYEITLEPDFQEFTFNGDVSILIEASRPTKTIIWHEYDLNIDTIEVKRVSDGSTIEIVSNNIDAQRQMRKIVLEEAVGTADRLQVNIIYKGNLNEDNEGFYRASYLEGDQPKWYATTQFEAMSARRAFPCYDEPALKATFKIRIIRPESYNSISNTRRVGTPTAVGDKFMDTFAETKRMSTYLVAFVVSQMKSTGEESNQSVYGEPRLIDDDRGTYARTTGIKTLAELQTYTGINYHFEKLDQVGISDAYFTFGAMENWGLVTYRTSSLFYKATINTSPEKEGIATIIAHEYAHQWFGNLVSPSWWEYIWLNEGFATYFASYIADKVESNMDIMSRYVLNNNQRAMESDSASDSRPMNYDISDPENIMLLFDRIAYQKSGAVIRMMEHFLTTDVFVKGLKNYLNAMQFDAAVPSDLWNALQTALDDTDPDLLGDDTVASIMDTWVSEGGYPLVTVSRTDAGSINLRQTRFILANTPSTTVGSWAIPINYVRSTQENLGTAFSDTTITSWLKGETAAIEVDLADDEWIILNKQSIGYYRVNYDDTTWQLITEYLHSDDYKNIPEITRSQLIDDIMNLAKVGSVTYNQTFDLLTYLEKETDYIPLFTYLRELDFLDKYLMTSEEHYDIFKLFVRNSLAAAYDDVQTATDHTTILKRNRVLNWLCKMEHENCMNNLHSELDAMKDIEPDMQSLVYCGGLITDQNTEEKWTFLFNRYSNNSIESLERTRITNALGCTTSEDQLNKWLEIIAGIDEENDIQNGDRVAALTATLNAHKTGFDTTFQFILDNFDKIDETLGVTSTKSVLRTLASKLTTTEQRQKVKTLSDGLSGEQKDNYGATFTEIDATIGSNINLMSGRLNIIKGWLEEYDSSGITFSVSLYLMLMVLLSHLFM